MRLLLRRELSDRQIVEYIRKGEDAEEKALVQLYKQNREIIIAHIIKNNGNTEAAKDIFQDTLVIFCEQVKKRKFEYQSQTKIGTYLFLIAKRLWINELKKIKRDLNYRAQNAEISDSTNIPPLRKVLEKEKQTLLHAIMDKLDEDCKRLLTYSIFEELSMQEICKRMGYKNVDVVKSKKYKCKAYLKKQIQNSTVFSKIVNELR